MRKSYLCAYQKVTNMKHLFLLILPVFFFACGNAPKKGDAMTIKHDCFVAVSEGALDSVCVFSERKDEAGIEELIANGRVKIFKKGMGVVVKGGRLDKTLAGSLDGYDYWILTKHLEDF